MIVQQITHYPPKADEPLAHKILEKLGEARLDRHRRSYNNG